MGILDSIQHGFRAKGSRAWRAGNAWEEVCKCVAHKLLAKDVTMGKKVSAVHKDSGLKDTSEIMKHPLYYMHYIKDQAQGLPSISLLVSSFELIPTAGAETEEPSRR